MKENKRVFLSWTKGGSRRTDSLSKILNFEVFRFSIFPRKIFFSPIKFPLQFFVTLFYLFKKKPDVIIAEFCQPIIGLPCLIYKYFFKKPCIIDLHSGPIISKKWLFLKPFTHFILINSDLIIIHEKTIKEKLIFEKNKKIIILHDPPLITKPLFLPKYGNYLIFPASGDTDEPIEELIKASFFLKDVEIFITGNVKKRKNYKIPDNLKFTGFLAKEDFYELLKNSAGVISLTKWDYTLTCSSLEALCFEKPVILTDKEAFKKFFKDAAIYVENNAFSISEGIKRLLSNYDLYLKRIKKLKDEYILNWNEEVKFLKNILFSL